MKKTGLSVAVTGLAVLFFIATAYAVGNEEYKPVEKTSDTTTAYIHQIVNKDGKVLLTVDDIDWYEGAEADKVFLEREPDSGEEGTPDGYYIVNDKEELHALEVAPNAQIVMQVFDKTGKIEDVDVDWNQAVTLTEFQEIFMNNKIVDVSQYPFHLTVQDGKVVKIIQQYLP
ncbi:hypothetical protein [Paenibacillus spongiae]|uniref:DUF4309 domain-containing protein n=1 Tax=Paenibacillus spongiae TaxID=2909671 RepID=A0ABY5S230_9BACL|nr:hypothetical protein [Paenibacillus spongiae]UVI27620.1 hypothetical protein L1F29_19325 [Paenibacillus spongiae]